MARPGGCVWAVAVTADETKAVSGGADGTVRVWDLASGQEQERITGHTCGNRRGEFGGESMPRSPAHQ
jgi:WD40 repeat protein